MAGSAVGGGISLQLAGAYGAITHNPTAAFDVIVGSGLVALGGFLLILSDSLERKYKK